MFGIIDDVREISGSGSTEGVTVHGEVEFVGIRVDSEVVFFAETFKASASLFHGAKQGGEPGGG